LKKPADSIRFWFYKPKTEKTESNPNRKKPEKNRAKPEKNRVKPSQTEKTEPNRFESVFVLKNQTTPKPVGLNRFQFGFSFFKKKYFGLVTLF
jgi:hypothetical protein